MFNSDVILEDINSEVGMWLADQITPDMLADYGDFLTSEFSLNDYEYTFADDGEAF